MDDAPLTRVSCFCFCWFCYRRFPGLRSFLQDGEAQRYRNVAVNYVRGRQALLHVFDDAGRTVDTLSLEQLGTKERLHAVMQNYFELKTHDELRREEQHVERLRQQNSFKKFHREEYVRKQHLYAQWFRNDVMQQEQMTWTGKDWLWRNYDKINRGFAVTKEDLLLFAQQYLLQKQHAS